MEAVPSADAAVASDVASCGVVSLALVRRGSPRASRAWQVLLTCRRGRWCASRVDGGRALSLIHI